MPSGQRALLLPYMNVQASCHAGACPAGCTAVSPLRWGDVGPGGVLTIVLLIVLLIVLTLVLFLSAPLSALPEACFLLQFGCPRRIGEGS